MAVERIRGCERERFGFGGVIYARDAEQAARRIETELVIRSGEGGRESRIGFGPSDEDNVVGPEIGLGEFEILANRHGRFERYVEMLLQFFGGVAVGAGFGHGAVDQ